MHSSMVEATRCALGRGARALTAAVILAACAAPIGGELTGAGGAGGATGGMSGTSSAASGSTGGAGGASTASSSSSSGAGGGSPSTPTASLLSRGFLCKLINNTFLQDPTPNQTQTRYNLTGTDLGIPVAVGNALHLFFGDTMGYKVIWAPGEDPDSVAQIPLADVTADPTSLCKNLKFYVTPDNPSVANGADPAIQRDFAGVYMAPPSGQDVANYIAQPAGPFTNMPGTFEVPTGGLAQAGKVFLFYAGLVETAPEIRATLGYLARWDSPGSTVPNFQILRPIDALFNGSLGGHFIQVAPVDDGAHVHLFGTGNYRRSGVYLARLGSSALETGGGEELFNPVTQSWKAAASMSTLERQTLKPLFETDGVGELSVRRIDGAGLYVALYQRQLHDLMGNINDNRVVFRVATKPEGPWSDALTIIDSKDVLFQSTHCCGQTCTGTQIIHCNIGWLYGTYVLPTATATPAAGGAFDVKLPFLASTWDPYNVVAFTASVHVVP